MNKNHYLKCKNCDFEFSVLCDEKDFEKDKEQICICPCGGEMDIIKVMEYE